VASLVDKSSTEGSDIGLSQVLPTLRIKRRTLKHGNQTLAIQTSVLGVYPARSYASPYTEKDGLNRGPNRRGAEFEQRRS